MSAGRDQWILFCLDDFVSEPSMQFSTLLKELVESDDFSREQLLQRVTVRERENLFKEILELEEARKLA